MGRLYFKRGMVILLSILTLCSVLFILAALKSESIETKDFFYLLGIIATSVVAISAIYLTAIQARINSVHGQMTDCLALVLEELILRVGNLELHLRGSSKLTAKNISQYKKAEDKIKYVPLPQMLAALPSALIESVMDLRRNLNEIQRTLKENQSSPNQINLEQIQDNMDVAFEDLRKFINKARKYIGTNKMKEIDSSDLISIKG